jgi:Cytochrome c
MSRITLLAVVAIVSFTSCSKERTAAKVDHQEMGAHGMTSDWKFTLPQGNATEGRKVFVEAECFKCHEIKGETFPAAAQKDKDVGPELSQMAGMHPAEFFADSIINPNAVVDPKGEGAGVSRRGWQIQDA